MNTRLHPRIRKGQFGILLVGMILFLCLGVGGMPTARAQEAWTETPTETMSSTSMETVIPTETPTQTETSTEVPTETDALTPFLTEPTTSTPTEMSTDIPTDTVAPTETQTPTYTVTDTPTLGGLDNQCLTHLVYITIDSEQIGFCAPTSLSYNVVKDNITNPNVAYAQLNQITGYGVVRIEALTPGNTPGIGMPLYNLGDIAEDRKAIWDSEISQNDRIVSVGPIGHFWSEAIPSIQIDMTLAVSSGNMKIHSYEWFVEHHNHLWVFVATWDTGLENQNDWSTRLNDFSVQEPDTLNLPDTAKDLGAAFLESQSSQAISALGGVVDVGTPSWWSGTCDANNYNPYTGAHATPLGSSWHAVVACGPLPYSVTTPDHPVTFPGTTIAQLEFECKELVMRFLYQEWGIAPWAGNANQIKYNYPSSSIVFYSNGTNSIVPGDILTEDASSNNLGGHTVIITSVNLDSNGTGTISILEQNSSPSGSRSLHVTNWHVDPDPYAYSQTIQGWLHVKANGGGGGTTCYSLNVNVQGGGTAASSPSTSTCGFLSFPAGTTVQLIATPYTGWHFANWIGGPSGGATTSYTVNGNATVTAVFAQDGVIPSPTPVPPPPASGWNEIFYSDNNLGSQCGGTRNETDVYIFRDSDSGWSPPSGCPGVGSPWSVRMERSDAYFQGGNYEFGMFYDDGARLYLDGNLIVDGWTATQHYESHTVTQGNHDLRLEYKNNAGHAIVQLWWRGPGALPGNGQTQDPNQWWVNYWGNQSEWQDSVGQQNEGTGFINHDWGSGGPGFGIPSDHFSIKYERTVGFECGTYAFHVKSDDGSRLSIDGTAVPQLDNWVTGVFDITANVSLQAGNHILRFDYFENGGNANVYLDWTKISTCTPTTPANLQWNSSSPMSITITWDDVSNEAGYNIYRWDGGSQTFIYLDSVGANQTSYTETRTTCGWDQYYEVSSYNSYGESDRTGWIHGTTTACPVLPDLSITNLYIPSSLYTNEDLHIWAEVTNQTGVAALAFWIDFYIDDQPAGCSDWGQYWTRGSGLAGFTSNYWSITIPAGMLSAGTHTVSAFVDSGCEVGEIDESNNISDPISFTVVVPPVAPPSHDDFDAAKIITGIPYTDNVDARGATRASDDPAAADCALAPGTASVWYQYTPSVNEAVYVDTLGSDYDTILAIWTGSRGGLFPVGCNDDIDNAGGIYQSAVQLNLTAGTTYYFEVAGWSWGVSSSSILSAEGSGSRTPLESGANLLNGLDDKLTPEVEAQGGGSLHFHVTNVTDITEPGSFTKLNPTSNAFSQASGLTLSWGTSSGVTVYSYCIDTVNNNACDGSWISTGASTSVGLSGLTNNGTYYWQVRAVNGGGTTLADGGTWWSFIPRNQRFADVPIDHQFWAYIEAMYTSGVTTGCGVSPLIYCPDRQVTRAEMAVFLERAMHYPSLPYTPPAASHFFSDMPVTSKEWMEAWVDQFYRDGITTGCGTGPLIYCPERAVTRAEMAVFILRSEHGSGYTPPAASGYFSDVPVTGKEWMESWIDQFYREGITTGCGTGPLIYCPEREVTRAEMAVFITRAFDLPMP